MLDSRKVLQTNDGDVVFNVVTDEINANDRINSSRDTNSKISACFGHAPLFEINVLPLQAQQLAPSEAAINSQHEKCLILHGALSRLSRKCCAFSNV